MVAIFGLKLALNQNMTRVIKKQGRIINRIKSKIAIIKIVEYEECLYSTWMFGPAPSFNLEKLKVYETKLHSPNVPAIFTS